MSRYRGEGPKKTEFDLSMAIKKAMDPQETAPKQKHVRTCIVYTWENNDGRYFWSEVKAQPILGDEVQCFKSLITVHKVMRNGHQSVLKQAINEVAFLEGCARNMSYQTPKGYSVLIRAYVDYLLQKLEFHRIHPEFTGTFSYEHYLSLKRTDDPNEGYETINDLLNLQEKLDKFQKLIFSNLLATTNNECRIASLVPLVEESYGIYEFMTNMLIAMHQNVAAHEALEPLRSRYNTLYYALYRFYLECQNLKYLTSLISIPKLGPDPPKLISDEAASRARKVTPPQSPIGSFDNNALELFQAQPQQFTSEEIIQQQFLIQQQQQQQQQQFTQNQFEEFKQQMEIRFRAELARFQMEIQHRDNRIQELEFEINQLRDIEMRDKSAVVQYDRRVKALEYELQNMQIHTSVDTGKDVQLRDLQEQLSALKSKYDNLSKLYSQLRTEHLDVLGKYKALQKLQSNVEDSKKESEVLNDLLKTKAIELAASSKALGEIKEQFDFLNSSHGNELRKLQEELEIYKAKGDNLEKKLQSIEQLNSLEKKNLENQNQSQKEKIDELTKLINGHQQNLSNITKVKEEESAILQSGMDQSLLALTQLQKAATEKEQQLNLSLENMKVKHAQDVSQIIDNILRYCAERVENSLFDYESGSTLGSSNATPELTLTTIEKVYATCEEFSETFTQFIANPGQVETKVVSEATLLCDSITHLLVNVKAVSKLPSDGSISEKLHGLGRDFAVAGKSFFSILLAKNIQSIPISKQGEFIEEKSNQVLEPLVEVAAIVETLIVQDISTITTENEDELADIVEREMLNAAKAIEEASRRLQGLKSAPPDPTFSIMDKQVHTAILDSAMAITNAIALLIKCATACQQEIVSQGKGNNTKTSFYKKNNRWTEGLISAAKAVAVSTSLLVETADGVLIGKRKIEELVVAAREVAAATAQLVAASRVKASFGSKTQDKLENAAKAVTNATKVLVSSAESMVDNSEETRRREQELKGVQQMGLHETKVKEMEQQVKILSLEKDLNYARMMLAEMRRTNYHK